MLRVDVPAREYWNERDEIFVQLPPISLRLEHSLYAMSRWEEELEKPFISVKPMTQEEFFFYIKCMSLDDIGMDEIRTLPPSALTEISDYISRPMSAKRKRRPEPSAGATSRVTETIYGWMTQLGIPFECDRWHFNRLMSLIDTCQQQRGGNKKRMSDHERAMQYAEINERRLRELHTTG